MIPKVTTPLTKFVRTTEFWMVMAANTALLVVPIVTTALPAGLALKLGVILNGTVAVCRTLLKMVAAAQPVIGSPLAPTDSTSKDVEAILQEIDQLAEAADVFQTQAGTPVEDVQHGLSPDVTSAT
jgi:hypothetical protein